MTCQCLACTSIDIDAHTTHANNGMGICKLLSKSGEFVTLTYKRECNQFKRASGPELLKRKAWHDQTTARRKP